MSNQPIPSPIEPTGLTHLLEQLRILINEGRRQALRAVDVVQLRTCWEVGRHIVEFEQGGATRADYGAKLIQRLAVALTADFGKGFDERNLRNMRGFFIGFPIWNAVRTELSWTHCISTESKDFYIDRYAVSSSSHLMEIRR